MLEAHEDRGKKIMKLIKKILEIVGTAVVLLALLLVFYFMFMWALAEPLV